MCCFRLGGGLQPLCWPLGNATARDCKAPGTQLARVAGEDLDCSWSPTPRCVCVHLACQQESGSCQLSMLHCTSSGKWCHVMQNAVHLAARCSCVLHDSILHSVVISAWAIESYRGHFACFQESCMCTMVWFDIMRCASVAGVPLGPWNPYPCPLSSSALA